MAVDLLLHRHVLALELVVRQEGKPTYVIFNGCALLYDGYFFWLTAGHLVKHILQFRRRGEIMHAWWSDLTLEAGVPKPPVDVSALEFGCIPNLRGIDVAVAGIAEFPSGRAVLARPDLHPLGRKDLCDLPCTPEGYYLVGSPAEKSELSQIKETESHYHIEASAAYGLLPVEQAPVPDNAENPDAFYGHLVGFDQLTPKLNTIEGMSGGPIFGIARRDNEIKYWFVGIQSSWFEPKRRIRVTPASQIGQFMRAVLEKGSAA